MPDTDIEKYLIQSHQRLTKEKLALEVMNLQITYKALTRPTRSSLWEVIIKALGNISAVFLLIVGITGPINKYFHERNNDLRTPKLTEEIKQILDKKQDSVKRSLLLQVGLQPPRIVAPILLKSFNDGELDDKLFTELFINMYFFSQSDIYYETILDKIASLAEPSNQNILENELAKSAAVSFLSYVHQKDQTQTNIVITYLLLIEKLKLNTKKPFAKVLDILVADCPPVDNDLICPMVKKLKNDKN